MNGRRAPVLDMHVHLPGVGHGGTGCWYHPERLRSLPVRLLLNMLRISPAERENDLDGAIRRRIVRRAETAEGLDGVVLLALDWARTERGGIDRERTDFFVPNEYVLDVARGHPRLHAGASVHPYRTDAAEAVRAAHAAGAVLLKWLPACQNFDPRDARCDAVYDALVDCGMPLLCHTGSEGATRVHNPAWNHPRVLTRALDRGVTVIAAHCAMRSNPFERDHADDWRRMLRDYPHLYGDTASMFGARARRFALFGQAPDVQARLLHGSDWPVPSSPWWLLGRLPLGCIRALARIGNPLARDLAVKRALGLPEAVFRRAGELLLPHGRGDDGSAA
jgi:predicted TIM-barrel fold metal-dependent hydrolase